MGLLPYIKFRVLYKLPDQCANHNAVYDSWADFEDVNEDLDIHRLQVNLDIQTYV